MTIKVDGVDIKLTDEQVAAINKQRKVRERCRNSFKRMLTHLGFKADKEFPQCFQHKKENWYAEIIDRGNYSDVWMTGEGLKQSSGFPGGWMYSEPQQIEEEILNFYNSQQHERK